MSVTAFSISLSTTCSVGISGLVFLKFFLVTDRLIIFGVRNWFSSKRGQNCRIIERIHIRTVRFIKRGPLGSNSDERVFLPSPRTRLLFGCVVVLVQRCRRFGSLEG